MRSSRAPRSVADWVEFSEAYGTRRHEHAVALDETEDGGYVIGTQSSVGDRSRPWLIRTDGGGARIQARRYPAPHWVDLLLTDVAHHLDGGHVVIAKAWVPGGR